jgi:hypothetical protein
MAVLLDFAYAIVISLSTYLIFKIPYEMIKKRKPLPVFLLVALITNIVYSSVAIFLLIYPQLLEDPLKSIGTILNIMQFILDLGNRY